ncbi:MAG: type II toxin-antitoxin system HicA family toxin [Proteobacteria bacterium]|nr:type II toxin-antitoxin system HicA family toxin [Pseudomonadota bacterium]
MRFLKSQGFIEDRQSGSHLTLYHKEKKCLSPSRFIQVVI